MTEPPTPTEEREAAYKAVQEHIRQALKEARTELDLNQTDFAKLLGAESRFVVNRLEHGTTELSLDQARQVDAALRASQGGDPNTGILEPLVERRMRLKEGDGGRDELLRRMLSLRGIEHVRVALGDELPLAELMRTLEHVRRVDVVVPTALRSALLAEGSRLDRFVEQQVTALLDVAADRSNGVQRILDLRIYESDDVRYSIVHVSFDGGVEVAWWARVRHAGTEPGSLPVANSGVPAICNGFEFEIDQMLSPKNEIRPHELLVTPRQDGEITNARLTRLAPRGAPPAAGDTTGECYGVALVLPYAYTTSQHGVGKRLLLHRRLSHLDAPGKMSLVSTRLDERDLQAFLDELIAPSGIGRARSDPEKSSVMLGRRLEERQDGSNIVPDDVFKLAAVREFRTYWNIPVSLDQLKPIPLPPELGHIQKKEGRDLIPRLFAYELDEEINHDVVAVELPAEDEESELARFKRTTTKHDPLTIGVKSLLTLPRKQLNDFLADAIESGFLKRILDDLGIADED